MALYADGKPANLRWWRSDCKEPHRGVAQIVTTEMERSGREELRLWYRLLRDDPALRNTGKKHRARINLIRNAAETQVARICRASPRPFISTIGGDFELGRRAERLTQWTHGEIYRLDLATLMRDAFMDACTFGTGILKFYEGMDGRPAVDRVNKANYFKARREDRKGSVRAVYQVDGVDREVLIERVRADPDLSARKRDRMIDRVADLPRYTDTLWDGDEQDDCDDLVKVYEAWRKPSGGETVGRHVVCTDHDTLMESDWEHDWFPFVEMRCSLDPLSTFGIGYPERMAGVQAEHNMASDIISDGARLLTPKVVLMDGTSLAAAEMTNEVGEVWKVSGSPPIPWNPPPASAELFGWRSSLGQDAYGAEGISQFSAQSQKPLGLNSGRAQIVNADLESERHVVQGQEWEGGWMSATKLLVGTAEDIAERGGKSAVAKLSSVAGYGSRTLTLVDFGEARMGDNPYQVQVQPVSSLAWSVSGRIEQVGEMQAQGLITDPFEARGLLRMPDIDRFDNEARAARDLSERLIELALDGYDVSPSAVCDLGHLWRQGWRKHAMAELDGADPDDLQPLRSLLFAAKALPEFGQPEPGPMPPGAMPGPGGPVGVPGMPQPAIVPPGAMGPVPPVVPMMPQ